MGLGTQYANNVLDAILGNGFTKDATVYVALFTAAPTAAGGGTECTGGSYARVSVTNNTTNWPNAATRIKSNGTAITFPTATAGWGTATHFAILNHASNAASSTNMLGYGSLGTAKTILTGDTPSFAAGTLVITETGS